MSGTVKIYGASDDLVEVEGDVPGCDEYDVGMSSAGIFVLACDNGSAIVVRCAYRSNGVWLVSAWPIAEGVPMPFATIRGEGAYSTSITVAGVSHVTRQALSEADE